MKRSTIMAVISILVPVMLGACGDDDNSQPSAAQGVYEGTVSAGSSPRFVAAILDDGDIWALYGSKDPATSEFHVTGFVQGSGTTDSAQSTYTTTNLKDFGQNPPVSGNLGVTYNSAAKTIVGNVSSGAGTAQVDGGPILGGTYDYNTPATLTTLSSNGGNWTLTSLQGDSYPISVAASGAFTFTGTDGCNGSGDFTPRPSGKNVFDVKVTFTTVGACGFSGAAGIAIAYPIAGTALTQLIVALTNTTPAPARAAGIVVSGIR